MQGQRARGCGRLKFMATVMRVKVRGCAGNLIYTELEYGLIK